MCLDSLRRFKSIDVGYRVLHRDFEDAHYYPLCYYDRDKSLLIGVWLDESDYRPENCQEAKGIYLKPNTTYPFGWHTFQTLKGAREWRGDGFCVSIVKVAIKDIVATGIQDAGDNNYHVVVSKKIKILEEVKDGDTRS